MSVNNAFLLFIKSFMKKANFTYLQHNFSNVVIANKQALEGF